ncbi:hypothetical protein A0256_23275 [Mucilaginibacter sp. PAMC 26640]|nr:hypothetical protein A0256_23275 [Mucilaginibacter sp. PAMC 26640]
MSIDEKIKNRETELQIYYDEAFSKLISLKEERRALEKRYIETHNEMDRQHKIIAQCIERANEQGYPNLFNNL